MIKFSKYKNTGYQKIPLINQNNIIFGDSIAEGWAVGRSWIYTGQQYQFRNFNGGAAYYLEQYTGKFWMNCGVGGNTVPDLLSRFAAHVTAFNPQILVINVGRNDVESWWSLATIKANFENLFLLCPAKTAFMSIPWETIGALQQMTTDINSWLQTRCNQLGFAFIDQTLFSQTYNNDHYYYNDVAHPLAPGYDYIVNNLIKPALISKGWI